MKDLTFNAAKEVVLNSVNAYRCVYNDDKYTLKCWIDENGKSVAVEIYRGFGFDKKELDIHMIVLSEDLKTITINSDLI